MNLLLVGCSFKTTPIELREKLAFDGDKLPRALRELEIRYGCEAVILSTCNRVEMYLAREESASIPEVGVLAEFLGEMHGLAPDKIQPHLYVRDRHGAIEHLFRVAASLDSLIVGEGQIAGQVKKSYELACELGTVGPILHSLFQQASAVAGKVRSETGIARGHVSVSSVAVDYVRQVFDHFGDKTVLVIGAGKMGELTLKHLKQLEPKHILVTNRSPEKAATVAMGCGGEPVPWEKLDDALVEADIVLSTTGAPEPIMTRRRFNDILARRMTGPIVILDIAVPRDFDPRIHDGDRACLFNIDDLQRIREQTLAERMKHIAPAESIVHEEVRRFQHDWNRRRNGPIIAKLTSEFETRRQPIVSNLMARFNGKLSDDEKKFLEGAFRLYQNQLLHSIIAALGEEAADPGKHTLRDALRKLFRLEE
jgi:glutamyl-tRNA reductase